MSVVLVFLPWFAPSFSCLEVYHDLFFSVQFSVANPTCNTEDEVLERFQAVELAYNAQIDTNSKQGQPRNEGKKKASHQQESPSVSKASEEGMLLANYMLNWLERYKQNKVRPSSYARYRFCLQLLCKDDLAHMDVREIKLEHIQEYINRLEEELSASTIKKQKLMLSQVLEHAMLTDVIQRNPVHGVQMPPMTHNTKVIYPYEKEEQEKLVAAFTAERGNKLRFRYGWGAVLILETGLRAGEALALEWCDIDEEKRTLKVNKNMVRVDGKNIIQRTTKTEADKRTILLNSKAMEAIWRLKAQQVVGCPYVFATQSGKHVGYRHLLTTMANVCEAAGVGHRGLHALRHSFASNL